MLSFTVQKIIIQRKEKISRLENTLKKTISSDARESLLSEIQEQQKSLDYFENMEVPN